MSTVATEAHEIIHEETGTFLVRHGCIVLDEALAVGCELDHGCRAGQCGSCAVEIVEGLENAAEPDAIEADALESFNLGPSARLACRMRAVGPMRLRRI